MADKSGTTSGLPFATADGKVKAPSNGGNSAAGGHNFSQSTQTGSNKGGGQLDVVKSRPQVSKAAPPGLPNSASIPKGDGGRILQMDPRPTTEKVGGTSGGVKGAPHTPFKGLK